VGDLFSLDIETTGLDRFQDRIVCIGVYSPRFNQCFDNLDDFVTWNRSHSSPPLFIAHRGAFDVNFLRQYGCDISSQWVYDTRSIASILIPQPRQAEGQKSILGLENLGISLLGRNAYKLDRTKIGSYSLEEIKKYCLEDCQVTYELFEYLVRHISERSWAFVENWVMPATKFCADLEWHGVTVDVEGLKQYQWEIEEQRNAVLSELNTLAGLAIAHYHEKQVKEVSESYREMYGKAKIKAKDQAKCVKRYADLESAAISRLEPFNWNSSEQLKWLLRDYYCLDIHNDREDKETTNEAMLKTLEHPVARKLCDYRELEKLVSTCIPALVENAKDSVVYASYNIGGTRTGRLSSSGPNLQQIPKGRIRSFIRAENSRSLLTIDYSQIEVRILAHLAKEKELIRAFEQKIDAYSVIAQKLLKVDCDVRDLKEKHKKERDVAKTAGLSILYGTGAAKLQEVLNKELNANYSLTNCRQFIEEYRASLPGVDALRKKLHRSLANQGVCYNLLGRPFYIESNDDIYMKGLNTLVQGSASDLVLWSQTEFVIPALRELGVDFKHRMIIHDEVVLELPADIAHTVTNSVIIPAMTLKVEQALNLTVPLAVEYTVSKMWSKP
jgi:DNA polymerase I-like protein with 3'-5' exonuclease and polymerase domains